VRVSSKLVRVHAYLVHPRPYELVSLLLSQVNSFLSGGYLPNKARGQKSEGYVHCADIYATLAAVAGIVHVTDPKAAAHRLPPLVRMMSRE
jgi:hypothetical protein